MKLHKVSLVSLTALLLATGTAVADDRPMTVRERLAAMGAATNPGSSVRAPQAGKAGISAGAARAKLGSTVEAPQVAPRVVLVPQSELKITLVEAIADWKTTDTKKKK